MKQFGFETDIERRSPFTGNVFMVDRMTSDWAEAHPFDVDGYIHEVAQKHGADEERVRLFFNYGLGKKGEQWATHCPAKHRDKVVKDPKTGVGILTMGKFPDYVNGCEPALIEAWNKAGEFHAKGLRQGDVLPEQTPACKITRLEDGGWIALFDKDKHLLDNATPENNKAHIIYTNVKPCSGRAANNEENECTNQGDASREARKPIFERRDSRDRYLSPVTPTDEESAGRKVLRGAGYLAAASLAIIIIYETGLIIPLGLIGLATSGLLR